MRLIFGIIVTAMTACFAGEQGEPGELVADRTPTLDDSRPQLPSPKSVSDSKRLLKTSLDDEPAVRIRKLTYPFVVPYPDGFDESVTRALPVARQFEEDGSFVDLYISGNCVHYGIDGVKTGTSQASNDLCARSQGHSPDPKKALAREYQRKYEKKAVRVTGAAFFKGRLIVKDPRIKQ